MISSELRDLDDTAPMSAAQLKKLTAHLDKVRQDGANMKPAVSTRAWLDARATGEKMTAARRRLVEFGLPRERVAGFPPDQVILLDEKREYEVRRDEMMKVMTLPVWQMEAAAKGVTEDMEPTLLQALLPALTKVRRAQGR